MTNLKKVFRFKQKCDNLKKNSSRGVRQVRPKTTVMVLLKSLKFGNNADQRGKSKKDAVLQRLDTSSCSLTWNKLPGKRYALPGGHGVGGH